jgi:hypothetical protein
MSIWFGRGWDMTKSIPWVILLVVMSVSTAEAQWEPLFNGKDLTGWRRLDGPAPFYVEDGMIAGEAVDGPDNTFLCTEQEYGDFILEFEIKIDEGCNSGVQIRSLSTPEYRDGKVHGYQVECDNWDRRWSGSILDEARRGWLYPMERNDKARAAFKQNEWNKFRVEACGNRIRTFVNGIGCADLVDDVTAKGFIGLQVHRVGKEKELIGRKVRWRNLRILTSYVNWNVSAEDDSVPQVNLVPNTLTDKERRLGYKLLWDGKTAKGWRGVKSEGFPEEGWMIEDGQLVVLASGRDIVSEGKYENFELEVQFKYSEGANSGIKYFIDPEKKGSSIGCEYQILDDDEHGDAAAGANGNRSLGSLFDLIPAENPLGKKVKKYEWNRARIVVAGDHVEHWLNGMKMVEYERNTQMWRAIVARSKYSSIADFGLAREGRILLQGHGHEVRFRSIKIREIKNQR